MHDIKTIIDIWNWYIKGILLGKENDEQVVLAKEMIKTKWLRKGKILDNEEFAHTINQLLESFSRKLGGDFVEEAIIWVSHPDCIITRVSERKRILDGVITHDDVQHLSDVLSETYTKSNYDVVKIIPVQRVVDERTRVMDPLDMEARQVELVADVFMLPKTFSTNLYEAFDRLDVHVIDIIPNILWGAEVALDFDVKDLWVLMIDIWANQTSYVVYEEWYPYLYGVLPLWWEEVTRDISIWLQVDIKDAEQIKHEKWVIMLDKVKIEDETVDVSFLSDIMIARYEEIFELIQQHLIEANKDGRLPWWVILMWWWAKAKNLDLLAKDVFKLAVFPAQDKVLKLWDISRNLQYINVIGDYVRSNKYKNTKKRSFDFSFNFWFIRGVGEFLKKMF